MCFCAQKIIMPFYICLRVIVEILKYMLCITFAMIIVTFCLTFLHFDFHTHI